VIGWTRRRAVHVVGPLVRPICWSSWSRRGSANAFEIRSICFAFRRIQRIVHIRKASVRKGLCFSAVCIPTGQIQGLVSANTTIDRRSFPAKTRPTADPRVVRTVQRGASSGDSPSRMRHLWSKTRDCEQMKLAIEKATSGIDQLADRESKPNAGESTGADAEHAGARTRVEGGRGERPCR